MIAREIERLQENHKTVINHVIRRCEHPTMDPELAGDLALMADTFRELLGYVRQLAERVEFEFDGRRPKR